MINLTSTSRLIKKYFGVVVAVILIISLGGLIYLRLFGFMHKENLPALGRPSFDAYSPKIAGINSQGLKLPKNQPKKLPIYQTADGENFLTKSGFFASKLNFKNKPKDVSDIALGAGKIYTNEGGSLSIYKSVVTYQKNYKKTPFSSTNINFFKTQAKKYFENLGVNTNLFLEPEINYSYISGESTAETQNPQKANFINLTYNYSVEGIKVISKSYQTKITMDDTGNVMGFNLTSLNIGSQEENYPLISPSQALDLVKKGQGQIIRITSEKYDASSQSILPSVQLNKADLAYFVPTNNGEIAQPLWTFEGTTSLGNSQVNLTIAIEAIKEEYFSSSTSKPNPQN